MSNFDDEVLLACLDALEAGQDPELILEQYPDQPGMEHGEGPGRQPVHRRGQRHGQASEQPRGRHERYRPIAQPPRYQDCKDRRV